jgi:hypothetical protein
MAPRVRLSVSRLSIAPIKSAGVFHPDRLELTAAGARNDRRFFVTDRHGGLITARTHPALILVRPRVEAGGHLVLGMPDGRLVDAPVSMGERVVTSFWGEDVKGWHVEGPLDEQLSSVLEEEVHLIETDEPGSAFDDAPVTLISTASVEEIGRGHDSGSDPRRYRMTMDIEGAVPFEEDGWVGRRVLVGTCALEVVATVGRCVITTIGPDTGTKGPDTLKLIAQKRGKGDGLPLGVSAKVVVPGVVGTGDTLDVV